jgi:hypothetical protein
MKTKRYFIPAFITLVLLLAANFHAEAHTGGCSHPDVTLHVNPELHSCDFDIAPELSQPEWASASRELGNNSFPRSAQLFASAGQMEMVAATGANFGEGRPRKWGLEQYFSSSRFASLYHGKRKDQRSGASVQVRNY